jgi:drug/metabolite transporter (DMT)-like permease
MTYWLYKGGAGRRTVTGNDALLVVALGVLLYAAVPALQFIGLDQTEAVAFNFVFQAGIPLVLALTAGVILKERTAWWEWVGVAVVAVGAWIFFPVAPTGADARGVLLATLAALFIGGSNLIQRHVLRGPDASALEVTALSMTIGASILAVMAIFGEERPSLTLKLIILLLVLGVVNTAVAFFIWHRAIQTLRALHIGVIASTQLVFVPVLSLLFLDEAFGLRRALGSFVVLVGVAVVHYSRSWANEHRSPNE